MFKKKFRHKSNSLFYTCGCHSHKSTYCDDGSQMSYFREALVDVSDNNHNSKICREAKSLATHELDNFEFLIAIIILFEMTKASDMFKMTLI